MSKNPGTVGFDMPNHGTTGNSASKNKSEVGFEQNPARGKAGKTSSKKNASEVSFDQKTAKNTGNSTGKNPGQASFQQNPSNPGGPGAPREQDKGGVVQKKATKGSVGEAKPVGPKITSIDQLVKMRKKKFGV